MFELFYKKNNRKYSIGFVNESDLKELQKHIEYNQPCHLRNKIEKLIEQGGWPEELRNEMVFHVMKLIVSNVHIDYENFTKNKITYKKIQKDLNSQKVFSLYNWLTPYYDKIIDQPNFLWDLLYEYKFHIKRFKVGSGEILLSMFTPLKKGSKGDLYYENDVIEIKGSGGRPGGTHHPLELPNKLKNIIHNRFNTSLCMKLNPNQLPDPLFIKDDELTWNQIIQTFYLYDWGFTYSEYIQFLIELRNENVDGDDLCDLLYATKSIINEETYKRWISKKSNTTKFEFAQYVAAMHITCYQHNQQFKHLLLINDKTKDAYSFTFKENIQDNLIHVYNQVKQLNKRLRFSLSIDSMSCNGISLFLR